MTKKLMILAAAVGAAFGAWADTETVGGYTWTYQINGDTAEIYNNGFAPISPTTGAVTIPSTLGGKPVTSIGNYAFVGCSGLTSVTIPNSVTSIGDYAFEACSGLTSVTIPGSVTSIGYYAFLDCSGLTNVVIGSGVTSIGDWAFERCRGLTSVTIPDSVTSIGERAFEACSGLTSVTIPDSVTSIGYRAFSGCSRLASVTIPESVTNLSTEAFDGCGRLWTAWYRTLANSSSAGGGSAGGGSQYVSTTIVQQVESRYDLADHAADRTVASVTVDGDCAIDEFVLKDGKVYDSMLYVSNTADREVTLSLPVGYSYKTFKGTKPLAIPAKSQCMISITRVADRTFLVAREDLEDVK